MALRNHLGPFFGRRPVEDITPKVVRQWHQQLAGRVAYDTVVACRSLLLRILQFATDEGAIEANPARRVSPPKPRRPRADLRHREAPRANRGTDLLNPG